MRISLKSLGFASLALRSGKRSTEAAWSVGTRDTASKVAIDDTATA